MKVSNALKIVCITTLALLALWAILFGLQNQRIENNLRLIQISSAVQKDLEQLNGVIQNGQRYQSDFLLTQNAHHLNEYANVQAVLPGLFTQIERHVQSLEHSRQLAELTLPSLNLIRSLWIDLSEENAQLLVLANTRQARAAIGQIKTGRSDELMKQINALVVNTESRIAHLTALSQQAFREANTFLKKLFWVFALFSAISLSFIVLLHTRRVEQPLDNIVDWLVQLRMGAPTSRLQTGGADPRIHKVTMELHAMQSWLEHSLHDAQTTEAARPCELRAQRA